MSQIIFDTIPPTGMDGTEFAAAITAFKDAVVSGLIGPTRPSELDAGGWWVDNAADPTWVFKLYTGITDVTLFTIDTTNGSSGVPGAENTFTISRTSNDAIAPILSLLKARIASNGQVKNGDVVGEIQFKGTDDDGDPTISAKIIFTATEDFTDTAFGGEYTFQVVTEGGTTLEDYLTIGAGKIMALKLLGVPALYFTQYSQTVNAGLQTLPNSGGVVKLTGNSTGYSINGIAAPGVTKQLTAINMKTGAITFLNDSAGAAANEEKIILPSAEDLVLAQYESATFQYSDSDSRWYLASAPKKKNIYTETTYTDTQGVQTFNVPAGVTRVRLRGKKNIHGNIHGGDAINILTKNKAALSWGSGATGAGGTGSTSNFSSPVAVMASTRYAKLSGGTTGNQGAAIDEGGTLWVWGANASGQLGDGTVTGRSIPVACASDKAIKAHSFGNPTASEQRHALILALDGTLYAVGRDNVGQLGDGGATGRSSPVAVLGNKIFVAISAGADSSYGIDNAGALWAWGKNTNGQLGLGDVTNRSSPVAVLRALTYADVYASKESVIALSSDRNTVYAWGINTSGQLGVGDVTPRSSPVAVLDPGWAKPLKFIAAGGRDSAASEVSCGVLDANGVVWTWGANATTGALGLGNTTPRSSPVAVTAPVTFVDFHPCDSGFCALGSNGVIYVWGSGGGTSGRLGDGTAGGKSTPTAVLGNFLMETTDTYYDLGEFTVTPGAAILASAGDMAYFGAQTLGGAYSEISIGYRA